jgi:hypothetical protein
MDGPLLAVRALCLDLHTWSVAEPERWAKWVAPCPVRDADLRHFQLRRRRLQERMANRTRVRQPLLPVLSQHVNDSWHRLKKLLEAAQAVSPGKEFVHDGTTWLRVSCNPRHNRPPVRVVNRATGELVRLSWEETLPSGSGPREEWTDFQDHLDKRRVELGSCGGPYGTPCAHEHACIRCPMLSINPKMLPRLEELEEDLIARRKRAVAEDWRGEVEGIDLTLLPGEAARAVVRGSWQDRGYEWHSCHSATAARCCRGFFSTSPAGTHGDPVASPPRGTDVVGQLGRRASAVARRRAVAPLRGPSCGGRDEPGPVPG